MKKIRAFDAIRVLAVVGLAGCSDYVPSQPTPISVALAVEPARVFYVGTSNACHLVYPDGVLLRWQTRVAAPVGRDGVVERVSTTVRDETEGAVVGTVVGEGQPIRAGETLTFPGAKLVGTCVPVDYTRHRFSLSVTVRFRDSNGTVVNVEAGPQTTGPAVPF